VPGIVEAGGTHTKTWNTGLTHLHSSLLLLFNVLLQHLSFVVYPHGRGGSTEQLEGAELKGEWQDLYWSTHLQGPKLWLLLQQRSFVG